VLATGAEELDGTIHDAMVGQSERGLLEGRRPSDQVIDPARAVE
jgi:hypothetical protein